MSLTWLPQDEVIVPKIKFYEVNADFMKALSQSRFPENQISTSNSQIEKIQMMMNWAYNLWKHDGGNDPGTMDPKVILEKAIKGENFRCVEYAILTVSAAIALGLNGRVVGLRTKDMETAEYGAGHVVAEVYNSDLKKWVMVDSQFMLIPVVDGEPSSVFDLVTGAAESKRIEFIDMTGKRIQHQVYLNWLKPYLYYIAIRIDQRYGLNTENFDQIILVPMGAKVPEKFQRRPIAGKVFPVYSPKSIYADSGPPISS